MKTKIKASLNLLKILALLFMLIDHIGEFIFSRSLVFRLIGRLSMPIFVYLVVQTVKRGKNLKSYFWHLLVLAIVTELLFFSTFQPPVLNIIFNFLGLLVLLRGPIWSKFLLIPIYALLKIDYSWLVLALGATFYLVKSRTWQVIWAFLANFIFCLLMLWEAQVWTPLGFVQMLSVLSLPLIFLIEACEDKFPEKSFLRRPQFRYFFYVFFPVHRILLFLLAQALS